MELLDSLPFLHDDELPAAMNLVTAMEARGFLRAKAAREVRKAVLRRLTASASPGRPEFRYDRAVRQRTEEEP
jgi:hypothetical protein